MLLHNNHGPCAGLPRVAGWGYPEPYTRDLMIAGLGMMASGHPELVASLRTVLWTLAENQSPHGHIPSLAHDVRNRGASDSTPLFLMTLAMYRRFSGDREFLDRAAQMSLTWMEYQSPDDDVMVAQLPTTDWRDEQWVLGFGLYVNTIAYSYLRLFGRHQQASRLRKTMSRFTITGHSRHAHVHAGLAVADKPYYALWAYKLDGSERFDLLGNSLAILTGIASRSRARQMVSWIEQECDMLRRRGDLVGQSPPNFFPYIRPGDQDWRPRYEHYNPPGEYHNGGIWPFICGFYVAALVAAGRPALARQKLIALTELIRHGRNEKLAFGFNEFYRAQDALPRGQDWQTWSASMYLYAAECVRLGRTPFFDDVRKR